MAGIEAIIESMRANPQNVRFSDLEKVCEHMFGKGRRANGSHVIFKTPWRGDPRINIQDGKGSAKAYQVRQVLSAIDKMKEESR